MKKLSTILKFLNYFKVFEIPVSKNLNKIFNFLNRAKLGKYETMFVWKKMSFNIFLLHLFVIKIPFSTYFVEFAM
jgi:hypothetical protein